MNRVKQTIYVAFAVATVAGGIAALMQTRTKVTPTLPRVSALYAYVAEGRLEDVAATLEKQGERVTAVEPAGGYVRVRVDADEDLTAKKRRLGAVPGVERVLGAVPAHKELVPDDQLYPVQWALRNTGANPTGCPDGVACTIDDGTEESETTSCDCCAGLTRCGGPDPLPHTSQAGIDISAEGAWDVTRGEGTLIAIIDLEFQRQHPGLSGALWVPPGSEEACAEDYDAIDHDAANCFGRNFEEPAVGLIEEQEEGLSHGGFIAGLIAARQNDGPTADFGITGAAPESQVMLLRVTDLNEAAAALNFAVANGAHVASMSLSFFTCIDDFKAVDSNFQAALQSADAAGVVLVVAAGNNGTQGLVCGEVDDLTCNLDLNSITEARRNYPVSLADDGFTNLVVVAAMSRDGTRPAFSHFGSNFVHLFAPGDYVLSIGLDPADPAGPRWINGSGTSFAAPYVAAVFGLVIAAKGITAVEAIPHIQNTVNADAVVDIFEGDVAWGGAVDAAAAVNYVP